MASMHTSAPAMASERCLVDRTWGARGSGLVEQPLPRAGFGSDAGAYAAALSAEYKA